MPVLIGALLAILVIGVILYPFIRARLRTQRASTPDSPLEGLRGLEDGRRGFPDADGREEIYEDVKTLQLEYELGTIEDKEFQERLHAYRLRAAAVLRDQERLEQEMDRSLEEEILKARSFLSNEHKSAPCQSCGRTPAQGELICYECGAELVSHASGQRDGGGDEDPLP